MLFHPEDVALRVLNITWDLIEGRTTEMEMEIESA
jgi:hypothetical protein